MEEMLETKTKYWQIKLEGCCRKRCHMCIALYVEEESNYQVFHPENKTKMLHKMVQHITHTSDLPHMDTMRLKQGVVIEGKTDGQAGGPPNIKQLVVVQKKEFNRNYGIPSQMYGVLFNQKHDNVFGKIGIGVTLNILKSSHRLFDKKYVLNIVVLSFPQVDKTDLVTGGIVIKVPLMYVPM